MIVNIAILKSVAGVRLGLAYQLREGEEFTEKDRETAELLDGDPELVLHTSEVALKPEKKAFSFLISFEESKEELEEKLRKKGYTLDDLWEDVKSFLFAGYQDGEIVYSAVAHLDTDNFHIHCYVANSFGMTGQPLDLFYSPDDLRLLSEYISHKYGVENPFSPKHQRLVKLSPREEFVKRVREKKLKDLSKYPRIKRKEELNKVFIEAYEKGFLQSAEDVELLALELGFLVKRHGRGYITLEREDIGKIRLRGTLYDREFKADIERERTVDPNQLQKGISPIGSDLEVSNRWREWIEKRRSRIERKFENLRREVNGLGNGVYSRTPEETFLPEHSLSWNTDDGTFRPVSPFQVALQELHDDIKYELEQGGETADRDAQRRGEFENRERRLPLHRNRHASEHIRRPELERWKPHSHTLPTPIERKLMDLETIRRQELQLIKELDPREVLRALGISNYREMNGYLLLRSPIREGDRNPSFAVFWGDKRNCWVYYDYATGWSGSCIDLWKEVRRIDYVEALREIREEFGLDLLEQERDPRNVHIFLQNRKKREREKQIPLREKLRPSETLRKALRLRFLYATKVTSCPLKEYLLQRGIKRIPNWLREVHFEHTLTGKRYYGLGARNYTGAWNVRSTKGKYVVLENLSQGQSFSLIKRGSQNREVVIVEGLFDALTLEELVPDSYYDIVILNGVGNVKKLMESGILDQYESIVLALDRDEQGELAKERILHFLNGKKEIKRIVYDGKDLNDSLVIGKHSFNVEVLIQKFPEFGVGIEVDGDRGRLFPGV